MNKIIIVSVIFIMLFSGLSIISSDINNTSNNIKQPIIQTDIKSLPMSAGNSGNTIYQTIISISNSPSGTGYYQQLLTIPFTININITLGNFYFETDNGVKLYAWIQSYNTSYFNVWIKIPNGT